MPPYGRKWGNVYRVRAPKVAAACLLCAAVCLGCVAQNEERWRLFNEDGINLFAKGEVPPGT